MLRAFRFNSFDLFGRVTGLCTQESKDFLINFIEYGVYIFHKIFKVAVVRMKVLKILICIPWMQKLE
jgi:hypothetical protein